jgi:hypothetical protein
MKKWRKTNVPAVCLPALVWLWRHTIPPARRTRMQPIRVLLSVCLLISGLPMIAANASAADGPSRSRSLAFAANLQQSPPIPSPAGTVTVKSNANLRQGPGTDFPVVGGAAAGATLEVVAQNETGDWYQLADCQWIFAALVESAPAVATTSSTEVNSAVPTEQTAAPEHAQLAGPATDNWTLVADSAADFPGGRDRNYWFYLWTEGRGNFVWQDMNQHEGKGCYQDTAGKGLEICADSITANPSGDVGLQWKASRGGTYRFEWDSASLKFYKHGEFVGILDPGTQYPFATTVADVIDWELFFWVAADSATFHVKVFRLDDSAAPAGAPAAPAAAEIPETPAASLSFGAGTQIVGADIAPGTYRSMGGDFCYWERLRGFGGTVRDIIANNIGEGPWIVTVSAADKGFDSSGCSDWTLDLSPITDNPTDPFGPGMYFIGKDIAPGTWQSSGGEACYWERLTGFSGQLKDVKANDLLGGPTVVEIDPGDQGFYSEDCGTWTRLY